MQSPRRVNAVQWVPKPSPGFRKTAPAFDVTDLVTQPHCPKGSKSRFACTDSQYVPGGRSTDGERLTSTFPLSPVYDAPARSATSAPGRLPESFA